MAELEAALRSGSAAAAESAVPWNKLEKLEPTLTPELKRIIAQAAKASEAYLPKGIKISFDQTNPRSVEWVKAHAAELVRQNIMPNSQQAIREIIRRAFEEGIAPRDAARMIREYIGILPRHALAVERYRQGLLKKFTDQGLITAASDAARLAEKYAAKLIRYRAQVIARNEVVVAANRGQRELWLQGVEQRVINPDKLWREWIVSDDDRLCEVCEPLEGTHAEIDGDYPSGLEPGEAHIMCRCTSGLVAKQ